MANKDVTSTSSASAISFYYSDNMSVGDIFYISSPKVEEGDKASPWCTTYEETLAKNLSITPSSLQTVVKHLHQTQSQLNLLFKEKSVLVNGNTALMVELASLML